MGDAAPESARARPELLARGGAAPAPGFLGTAMRGEPGTRATRLCEAGTAARAALVLGEGGAAQLRSPGSVLVAEPVGEGGARGDAAPPRLAGGDGHAAPPLERCGVMIEGLGVLLGLLEEATGDAGTPRFGGGGIPGILRSYSKYAQ